MATSHVAVRSVHRSVGGVVDVALVTQDGSHLRSQRGSRRLARRRRPPRTRAINVISASRTYFSELEDIINEIARDIRSLIVPLLPRAVEESESELTRDAAEDDINGLFEGLREKYRNPRVLLQFQTAAEGTVTELNRLHRTQTQSQLSSLGIDIFRESPRLSQLLTRFTRRNVELIRTIPSELIAGAERTIRAGIASGLRHEEISRQLLSTARPTEGRPAGEVRKARQRAALIARDQVLTASQNLSRARQRANGIDRFIWRTVGDDRVRDLHEDREGQEFSWETGASGGDPFPGSGINCRCWSEPVLP